MICSTRFSGRIRSAMQFEKLKKVSEGSGAQSGSVQKLFSSHPDTDTRIKRMSERSKTDGEKYFKSVVANSKGLNSTEYYKLLNKLGGEYLAEKFKKEHK